MPTYEYRCKSCGHELEVQQSFTDDPLTQCPACAGELRKVFGNIAVSFKGSGFYKTDSRKASGSSSASSDSSSSDSSSKSDSKSESKTEKTSEKKSEKTSDSSSSTGSSSAAAT